MVSLDEAGDAGGREGGLRGGPRSGGSCPGRSRGDRARSTRGRAATPQPRLVLLPGGGGGHLREGGGDRVSHPCWRPGGAGPLTP